MISVYTVLTEKEQSEGLCDCIIETKNDIYIFEFKLNGTAIDALKQIEDKGYARPYLSDARTIHKNSLEYVMSSKPSHIPNILNEIWP